MTHAVFITFVKSVILWVLFLLILLPVLTPIFLVLFAYKRIVICAARIFGKSELIEPIGGIDISFCVDDFWTRPKGSISYVWILKGPIDPKLIYDRFDEAINAKIPANKSQFSQYNYERLTSLYPSFWMSIPFWTKTKEPFQMKNHMKIIKCPVDTSSSSQGHSILSTRTPTNRFKSRSHLNSFLSSWMQQKFSKNLPLFEVLVIPEFLLNDSTDPNNKLGLMALKTHHIIGDGYSKLKLLGKVVDGFCSNILPEENHSSLVHPKNTSVDRRDMKRNDDHLKNGTDINPSPVGKHWWSDFDYNFLPLLLILLTPITLWKLGKDFVFHRDCFTHHKSTSNVLMSNTILDMEKLKRLRRKFKNELNQEIPLIVIGASVLAGALRRLHPNKEMQLSRDRRIAKEKGKNEAETPGKNALNRNGVINNSRISRTSSGKQGHGCALPKHTNFVMALPLGKRHPGDFRFCNHWTHGIFNVEVQEPDCIKRMLKLNENFQANLSLRWPEVYHSCLVPWQSLFPRWMWKMITDFRMGAPIGSTNLSGPSEMVRVGGKEVLEKYAYVGLLWRHSSMTCAFLSYNGMLTATMVANQDVITSQTQADILIREYMQSELEELLSNFNGN